MSFAADDELLGEFKVEALEALDEAEAVLVLLEGGADFNKNFDKLFRTFHSLKGGAGMFGLTELQKLVHHIETLLDRNRSEKTLNPPMVDYILRGVDWARELIHGRSPKIELIDPQKETRTFGEPQPKLLDHRPLVWIVDDEPEILEVFSLTLKEYGFDIVTYGSGHELLRALGIKSQRKPDVVLSDLKMPDMDGLDLQRKIKEIDPYIQVALISGFLDKDALLQGSAQGVDAFLEKPVANSALYSTVSALFEKGRGKRLLRRTIKFMMYQFSDLDAFLKKEGRGHLSELIRNEINDLIIQSKP